MYVYHNLIYSILIMIYDYWMFFVPAWFLGHHEKLSSRGAVAGVLLKVEATRAVQPTLAPAVNSWAPVSQTEALAGRMTRGLCVLLTEAALVKQTSAHLIHNCVDDHWSILQYGIHILAGIYIVIWTWGFVPSSPFDTCECHMFGDLSVWTHAFGSVHRLGMRSIYRLCLEESVETYRSVVEEGFTEEIQNVLLT